MRVLQGSGVTVNLAWQRREMVEAGSKNAPARLSERCVLPKGFEGEQLSATAADQEQGAKAAEQQDGGTRLRDCCAETKIVKTTVHLGER